MKKIETTFGRHRRWSLELTAPTVPKTTTAMPDVSGSVPGSGDNPDLGQFSLLTY